MSRKASGLRAWALQRLTAVYVGLFTLYLLGVLMFSPPADFIEWRAWLGGTGTGVAMLLFVVSVLLHAWIGVRDVVIDYIHPIAIRATVLGVVGLALAAMGLWATGTLFLARVG